MSCRTEYNTATYSAVSAAAYLAQPAPAHQPLLIHGVSSDSVAEAVLGRYTGLEVAHLEEEAARLATQLHTFVAQSQYELGAEWPEQIFKPVLGKIFRS